MSGPDDMPPKPGHRKDGKPYKENNTREDGSYKHGKYRAPEHSQFRKGDGRPRGKREKGSKNQDTIWGKRLSRKRTIDGETMSNNEWLVEATIRRGITRSDRAAEKALEHAARLERNKEGTVIGRENEVIAAYFAQKLAEQQQPISEDQLEDNSNIGNEAVISSDDDLPPEDDELPPDELDDPDEG